MDKEEIVPVFKQNVKEKMEIGGNLIVPVFSLGRSQEILKTLHDMQKENMLDSSIPIYFDGKLAIKYTHIYLKDGFKRWLWTCTTLFSKLHWKFQYSYPFYRTFEGSLGRNLRDTPYGDFVKINGLILKKFANVEFTSEFSAHAKADEMINFLNEFKNLKAVLVNHGEIDVKDNFAKKE